MDSVSVISVGFLTVLGVGAALLWLASWSVRRRRGRTLAVCVAALALVCSLATAADAVNAHYQYLPRVGDVIGARDWPTVSHRDDQWLADPRAGDAASAPTITKPRGAVVSIAIPDTGVGFQAGHALVYLPPQYFTAPTRRFPVVYLLHGSPGMPVDWLRGGDAANAGLLAARAGRPQILVMPHLSRNWLDDSECVDGARMRVETYVVDDLVPAVDRQLRTVAEPAGRSLLGMSAGGYCALNLGLRHRSVFGSIVDMSGYTHPTHAGGMVALFGARPDLASVVAANSPDSYAADLSPAPATRLYLLCGTADRGPLEQLTAIRRTLTARGLAVSWRLLPGGHTFGVWRPGLVDALGWTPAPQTAS